MYSVKLVQKIVYCDGENGQLSSKFAAKKKQTQKTVRLVTIVKTVKNSEYDHEISQSQQQTNSWHREEEPHKNHETLGR